MKTNLAYIDTATSEALARELKTPTLPAKVLQEASQASLTLVAGFIVRDEAVEQCEIDKLHSERRANIVQYRNHRDEVAAELDKLGVKPLAIVPKTAWERICASSGLFRLEPNSDGEIGVSNALLEVFEKRAKTAHDYALWTVTLVLAIASCVYFLTFLTLDTWWIGMLITFPTFFASAILSGIILGVDPDGWKQKFWKKRLVRLQIRHFSKKPWEEVLKGFLPNGVNEGGFRVHVVLPKPPAEVARELLKVKSLNLKVAAVAEAIAFSEAPGDILRREHDRKSPGYRGYASYEEWLEKCPIIYYEHESAVAIIAQFGDFPIEQRVVDEVVNSEYLV